MKNLATSTNQTQGGMCGNVRRSLTKTPQGARDEGITPPPPHIHLQNAHLKVYMLVPMLTSIGLSVLCC